MIPVTIAAEAHRPSLFSYSRHRKAGRMLQGMRPLQLTFRFFLFGVLVLASFCLLSVVWAAALHNTADTANAAAPAASWTADMTDSPNAVSRVMAGTFSWTNAQKDGLQAAVLHAPRSAGAAMVGSGRFVDGGVAAIGRGIGRGIGQLIGLPGAALRSASRFSLGSVIQPHNAAPLPTIEIPPTAYAATTLVRPASATGPPPVQSLPTSSAAPAWPLHGRITTLFGVPEPPYEPIHTGMDISDGRGAGVTPIHPFEAGRVIEAVHARIQLGNHVVIDHGGGLTSVYGHLASISVTPGQVVDQNTVLGYEGSTGVSTGPHLHFEIRQNNRPVNPELYIPGRP